MRIAQTPRCYTDGVDRLQTSCGDWVGKTRQDQAHLVNINNIYRKTQLGELPIGGPSIPQFGDFSNEYAYDEALNFIQSAQDKFMELPAEVRKEYDNDAGKWYEATIQDAQERHNALLRTQAEEQARLDKESAIAAAKALLGEE